MKYVTQAVCAMMALSALSIPANAQWNPYSRQSDFRGNFRYNGGVNGTQAQLQSRINIGVRNGSLTEGEAAMLQGKLNQIEFMEQRMRVDGLSSRDRQRLRARLDRLSSDIDRQINDFQRRRVGFHGYRHFWPR